ncbi:sulfotransferase 1B1-like isoform X2 [Haematobia irritans]|uniref:sulfotransferase 1B1-like isoform X2 n=1 Tax=Haematobia irritans TaxID=7368 RepID=UPI003F4FF599
MFISRPITTELCKTRNREVIKEYAASGNNIPLKKNWLDTWCTMHAAFDNVVENILRYPVRPDDIFIVTYMKSGTTWMQETVWLLMNNLDFEKSKQIPLLERSPFLDKQGIRPIYANAIEQSKLLASPRVLQSHLSPNLLPCQIWEFKTKIIYVARNCKDVIVSSYHFSKNIGHWCGDNLEEYVDDFINNKVIYGHFWTRVMEFWKMRDEPNILFVTYEEMKRNLKGVISRLCEFLERPQLCCEDMEKLLKHLSFESMRENDQVNFTNSAKEEDPNSVTTEFQLMRRGIIGSFKDEITPELQAKIDNWSSKCLAQYGITEGELFGNFQ